MVVIVVKDKYQYEFVKSQLKPSMVCLDIGANVGLFTKLMASECTDGEVYAYEPDINNYESLKENTTNFHNVYLHNLAITDYTGHIRLYKCESNIGMHRVYPSQWCSSYSYVKCLKIDDIWLQRLDFVKIDVEGSEWGVLQGMKKTILKFKPKMIIEFHPTSLEECDRESPKKIYDFLIKYYDGKVTLLASTYRPESKDIENISFDELVSLTRNSSSRNIFVSR